MDNPPFGNKMTKIYKVRGGEKKKLFFHRLPKIGSLFGTTANTIWWPINRMQVENIPALADFCDP